MATVLLWYVGVTLALAASLTTVICMQFAARSSRRHATSVHRGGQDQARAPRP